MTLFSLEGRTALVTGAARGIGFSIASALGQAGARVVLNGRSQAALDEAAAQLAAQGIAVATSLFDVTDQPSVNAGIAQIEADVGAIDILVNNVAAIHDELTLPGRFWEKPLKLADIITVGIRSSYVASYHAAPMMVDRGQGLIVFTSGSGASHYVYGPGYGAHKVSQDKMAADMAIDLRDTGVTALSIWMGALRTGRLLQLIASDPAKYAYLEKMVETPEFTGHVIWALSQDPALADHAGQTLIGAELAEHYGLRDVGDRQPPSYRQSYGVAPLPQYDRIIR